MYNKLSCKELCCKSHVQIGDSDFWHNLSSQWEERRGEDWLSRWAAVKAWDTEVVSSSRSMYSWIVEKGRREFYWIISFLCGKLYSLIWVLWQETLSWIIRAIYSRVEWTVEDIVESFVSVADSEMETGLETIIGSLFQIVPLNDSFGSRSFPNSIYSKWFR